MKGFKTTEEECNRNNRIEEKRKQFAVEFNRYYFTKRYENAFDFCINNIADEEIRHVVYTKAMLAIEKLTNRIDLSDKSRINKDWVIDALVNYGHKNMKLNGDEIQIGLSVISVTNNNQVKIKGHSLKHPALAFLVAILMLFSCFSLGVVIFELFYYFFTLNKDLSAILTCLIVISWYVIIMYKVISMQFEYRKLIRKLATSILNHYNNL